MHFPPHIFLISLFKNYKDIEPPCGGALLVLLSGSTCHVSTFSLVEMKNFTYLINLWGIFFETLSCLLFRVKVKKVLYIIYTYMDASSSLVRQYCFVRWCLNFLLRHPFCSIVWIVFVLKDSSSTNRGPCFCLSCISWNCWN